MSNVLDFTESRNTYHVGSANRWRSQQQKPHEQVPKELWEQKDLFLQIVRLSSGDAVQESWPRIVRHEVEITAEFGRGILSRQSEIPSQSPEPDSAEEALVDPDRIVEFISSGGRKAVFKVARALRNRAAHGDAFRALEEALVDAMQNKSIVSSNIVRIATSPRESFVQRAQRLDSQDRTDAALDLLYDAIDEMLRNGQFSEVDSLLAETPISECSVDLLLGLLTATLPARSRLQSRPQFFHYVEHNLKSRAEYEDGLLTGLQ